MVRTLTTALVIAGIALVGCKGKEPIPKPAMPAIHPGYFMLTSWTSDLMLSNALSEANFEGNVPSDALKAGDQIPVYFCMSNHWLGIVTVWDHGTAWNAKPEVFPLLQ